jgi:HK97 family phage portal protein
MIAHARNREPESELDLTRPTAISKLFKFEHAGKSRDEIESSRSDFDPAIRDPFKRDGEASKMFALPQGFGGYRMQLQLAGEAAMSRPFLQNPTVYSCTMAIVRAFTQVPPTALNAKTGEPISKEALAKSRLWRVLRRRPNAWHSGTKLQHYISMYHCLFGETFLFMLKGDGKQMRPVREGEYPDEIWPVRGELVQEVLDDVTKLPKLWKLVTRDGVIEYPVESVVQISAVDPYNPIRGVGPMQAAWRCASKDFQIDRYDEALIANGGSPGGVLTLQGNPGEPEIRAIRKAWNDAHSRVENTRETAVLPLGTTFQQLGFNPKDMEFSNLRVWNRDIVMGVYGVTKPIIGLTEGLNYASAREAFRVFWEVTMVPFLEFVESEIQFKLFDRLNGPESEWLYKYDLSNVASLKETLDAKVDRTVKLVQQGGQPFNVAKELAGWKIGDVPDGDQAWVPQGVQVLPEHQAAVDAANPPPEPQSPPATDAETPPMKPPPEPTQTRAQLGKSESAHLYQQAQSAHVDAWAKKLATPVRRVFRDLALYSRKRMQSLEAIHESALEKLILTRDELRVVLLLALEDWRKEMRGAVEQPLRDLFDHAASEISREIGGTPLSSSDPFGKEFLASAAERFAQGPLDTVMGVIEDKILAQLAQAPDIATTIESAVKARIGEITDDLNKFIDALPDQADRVASTEAQSVWNGVRELDMRKQGVTHSMWLTARDERVRPHHVELDGLVRPIGQVFGYNLRFPGDPQAAAEDVINCRCALVPQVNPGSNQ